MWLRSDIFTFSDLKRTTQNPLYDKEAAAGTVMINISSYTFQIYISSENWNLPWPVSLHRLRKAGSECSWRVMQITKKRTWVIFDYNVNALLNMQNYERGWRFAPDYLQKEQSLRGARHEPKKLSVTAYLAATLRNTEIWNCHLLSPVINGFLSCCHQVGSSLFTQALNLEFALLYATHKCSLTNLISNNSAQI